MTTIGGFAGPVGVTVGPVGPPGSDVPGPGPAGFTGPTGLVGVGLFTIGVNPGMDVNFVGFCERQPAPSTTPTPTSTVMLNIYFFMDYPPVVCCLNHGTITGFGAGAGVTDGR